MSAEMQNAIGQAADPKWDAAYLRGYADAQKETELRKLALSHGVEVGKLLDYGKVVDLANEYLTFLKGGKP